MKKIWPRTCKGRRSYARRRKGKKGQMKKTCSTRRKEVDEKDTAKV